MQPTGNSNRVSTNDSAANPTQFRAALQELQTNLQRAIFGKSDCIETLIVALLAGGSVLIEDVPGVGKTTLAKALARSIDAQFRRIQFTPDLLPADILGSSLYNPVNGTFDFRRGPIFCHVLLADEINRASPRTQSALLEAMNERQATIEGTRHPLPEPFMVLATQNPIEFHGTYPLPEAQMDRFLIVLDMGYPDSDAEVDILQSFAHNDPLETLQPVLHADEVRQLQKQVQQVRIEESISRYVVEIVRTTREDTRVKLGVSPRGALMLSRASQALALMSERDYVLPDDVQRLAVPVLSHRLVMTNKSNYDGTSRADVIRECLAQVKVPT